MNTSKKPMPLTSASTSVDDASRKVTVKIKSKDQANKAQKVEPLHSPAFHIFSQSIQRSKNLLKIHKEAHGKQAKPEKHLSDVHRAAVVLAISALDAFISQYITTRIRSILADESKEINGALLNKIKEATEKPRHTLIIDAVKKNNIRQLIVNILQEEYERKTFQGTESIEDCMKIIGYDNIFKTIASKAKLNEDDLKKELNLFTKRRHIIVHRGDFDTTENPPTTENPITKSYASRCILLIEVIAKQINELK